MGVHKDDPFNALLAEFPELLVRRFTSSDKHGVEHFIMTDGPPVFAKALRLDPEKLAVAKEKFRKDQTLNGHHRCIWCPKKTDLGAHVVITGA